MLVLVDVLCQFHALDIFKPLPLGIHGSGLLHKVMAERAGGLNLICFNKVKGCKSSVSSVQSETKKKLADEWFFQGKQEHRQWQAAFSPCAHQLCSLTSKFQNRYILLCTLYPIYLYMYVYIYNPPANFLCKMAVSRYRLRAKFYLFFSVT